MTQENDNTYDAAPEKTRGFLTALFTGWGLPGNLARILTGAVLGALSALWALSQSSCTAEWVQGLEDAPWHGVLGEELMAHMEASAK